jgi:LacI family transcriptional regulator
MPIATIRDLARAAGVHYSTVSLALRNHPRISRETCRRIQNLARERGYHAHPMVASLMEYVRTAKAPRYHATLGFIAQDPNLADARKYSGYTYGLARAHAELLGYATDFFCVDGAEVTTRKLSDILIARGIQGLIVTTSPGTRLDLDWSRFSTTALGYGLVEPQLHRVCSHHFEVVHTAVRELHQLGYRRIGLMLPDPTSDHVDEIFRAAFIVQAAHIEPANRIPPLVTRSWEDRAAFLAWYRKHQPDAVISNHLEVLNWIRSTGRDVPGDVGFASLDVERENPLWAQAHRDLSGIDTVKSERMAAVVDLTLMQLQRNERGVPSHPRLLMTEPRWLPGQTVRQVGAPVASYSRKGGFRSEPSFSSRPEKDSALS